MSTLLHPDDIRGTGDQAVNKADKVHFCKRKFYS